MLLSCPRVHFHTLNYDYDFTCSTDCHRTSKSDQCRQLSDDLKIFQQNLNPCVAYAVGGSPCVTARRSLNAQQKQSYQLCRTSRKMVHYLLSDSRHVRLQRRGARKQCFSWKSKVGITAAAVAHRRWFQDVNSIGKKELSKQMSSLPVRDLSLAWMHHDRQHWSGSAILRSTKILKNAQVWHMYRSLCYCIHTPIG